MAGVAFLLPLPPFFLLGDTRGVVVVVVVVDIGAAAVWAATKAFSLIVAVPKRARAWICASAARTATPSCVVEGTLPRATCSSDRGAARRARLASPFIIAVSDDDDDDDNVPLLPLPLPLPVFAPDDTKLRRCTQWLRTKAAAF